MITTRDLEWTAGFFEGEAHLRATKKGVAEIKVGQVQQWPLDKLRTLFGGSFSLYVPKKYSFATAGYNIKPLTYWTLSGVQAIGLMMTLYPMLSPKRQGQVLKALSAWRAIRASHRYRQVCKQGHPLTGSNLARRGGKRPQRACVTCRRAALRRFHERHREDELTRGQKYWRDNREAIIARRKARASA